MSDFDIGLQMTALGMGLVFLALVIVMLAIMALDRLFRPKAATDKTVVAAPAMGAALPVTAAVAATAEPAATGESDALDEATAIGVAIAAAIAARASVRTTVSPRPSRSTNPLYATFEGGESIPGEAVLVATVDGGSGVWSRAGRLAAMN